MTKILMSRTLTTQVSNLKETGTSFLGCVAFVQKELNISLSEAKSILLNSDIYSEKEKDKIKNAIQIMLDEFEK